jgi:hypothetical protein
MGYSALPASAETSRPKDFMVVNYFIEGFKQFRLREQLRLRQDQNYTSARKHVIDPLPTIAPSTVARDRTKPTATSTARLGRTNPQGTTGNKDRPRDKNRPRQKDGNNRDRDQRRQEAKHVFKEGDPRQKYTKDELRAKLQKEGRCYTCHKTGHRTSRVRGKAQGGDRAGNGERSARLVGTTGARRSRSTPAARRKLAPLAARGHQSGDPLAEERNGRMMLNDDLIYALEKAMSVNYSVIISEFIPDDSPFLAKHCPPHAATSEKLRNRTCLAVLSERTAQAFLHTVDQVHRTDPLTMVTPGFVRAL